MPTSKTSVPQTGNPPTRTPGKQQAKRRKPASSAQSKAAQPPSPKSPLSPPGLSGSVSSSSACPTATLTTASAQNDVDEVGSGDGFRPGDWKTSGSDLLNRLVEKSRGAVSRAMVLYLKQYLPGTKIIFVVGQTGVGKSTLIQEITGRDVYVGHHVQSGTQRYEVCPALIKNKQYIFVDTVGFGAADKSDWDTFKDIVSCLDAFGTLTEVAGILFVCEPGARFQTQDRLTLQWMKCFCGPALYHAVTIVTTKWDNFSKTGFEGRWAIIKKTFEQPEFAAILNPQGGTERYDGASLYHHGLPGGVGAETSHSDVYSVEDVEARSREIRALIAAKYSEAPNCNLQLTKELTNKITLLNTQSAKVLTQPSTFKVCLEGDMACVVPFEEPRVQEAPAEKAHAEKAQAESPQKSAKPSANPESADIPSSFRQPTPTDGRSWYERLLEWVEIGTKTADSFAKMRKKQLEDERRWRQSADPVPPSATAWTVITSWWNGSK